MSEHTKDFINNLEDKDYLKARENLKSAIDSTIKQRVEDAKEKVRKSFSDE